MQPSWRDQWRRFRSASRRLFAIPDYDAYLEHCRRTHPDGPMMSHDEFFRYRLEQRYGRGSGGMRCC